VGPGAAPGGGVPAGGIDPRIAASTFCRDVGGARTLTSVGLDSCVPPRVINPGTTTDPSPAADGSPPSILNFGPAENPASCDPGGDGISVVFTGFNPTIASDAVAPGVGVPLASDGGSGIAGAAAPTDRPADGGANPRGIRGIPGEAGGAAANCGASGNAGADASPFDRPGGAVNARLGPSTDPPTGSVTAEFAIVR